MIFKKKGVNKGRKGRYESAFLVLGSQTNTTEYRRSQITGDVLVLICHTQI